MKKLALVSLLTLAACSTQQPPSSKTATSQPEGPPASYLHKHPGEIPLRNFATIDPANPTAMNTPARGAAEVVNWRDEVETTSPAGKALHFPVVTNIHNPSITPYFPPAGKATGCALIIAPGGGHMFLSIDHEGYDVADYLSKHGITCFVLKYRLARAPGSTYKIDPDSLDDARRAVRMVRARAAEFRIDPERVGVLGFSAGGELATLLVNKPVDGDAASSDPIDRQSARLNFQCLLYPGRSTDVATVAGATPPPTFLAASEDDRPDISQGLAQAYLRLKALNVATELHLYNSGGHGFGVRPRDIEESEWPTQLLGFLNDRGFLHKGHSVPVNMPAARAAGPASGPPQVTR